MARTAILNSWRFTTNVSQPAGELTFLTLEFLFLAWSFYAESRSGKL